MSTITSHSIEISDSNTIKVEAGTNCPQGGDSGHGGRTYLSIEDTGGTVWRVKVRDEFGNEQITEQPSLIEIELGGDTECATMIRALEIMLLLLKEKSIPHDAKALSRTITF